ncbi:MAG: hypothetical protein KME60_03485 [Cyanomargarita calcarea GSE-NOS-MK-12-04C]|jgi:hypothetical protein|uniref:Uncharacterized protein n=1 Tax=Cyanomargarita calcarea GSE-NOS-MK-12-04C TaxID=2839659 RepID=A0A951QHQ8_9CYAN|nr:hypothetical protein [Cyanomargarita calcarea GSE-NOS-MK-12-04C]
MIAGVGTLLFLLVVNNVAPYTALMQNWAGSLFAPAENLFSGVARWLNVGIYWLLGVITYSVVQSFELFPRIIKTDRQLIQKLLNGVNNSSNYQPRNGDSKVVKGLKKVASQGLIWAYAHLETVKNIAYVIDSIVCYMYYPFVKSGNWADIFGIIYAGKFDQLDYGNIAKFFLTVKGVEWALEIFLALWEMFKAAKSVRSGESNP